MLGKAEPHLYLRGTKLLDDIPKGDYCYSEEGICPYWKLISDRPYQENGWCSLMEIGDVELNSKDIWIDMKTMETVRGFRGSCLWDQVKECGIDIDF